MRSWVVLALFLGATGCRKTPMDRVEAIRSELSTDSPKWSSDLAKCDGRPTCAKDVATSIGGPFDDKKPDQISAAAAAVVIARDGHGSDVGSPDVWLAAMRKAKGAGADALRLATAWAMSTRVHDHARSIDDDAGARAFLRDVAAAIPGACSTYDALGSGAVVDSMAPAESPDHSACVQRDLARKDGPGPAYGEGLFRGAAGALALWKETLAALHEGASQTTGNAKEALDKRLAAIDASTAKIVLKTVAAPAGNSWNQMQEEHNSKLGGDAGAPK